MAGIARTAAFGQDRSRPAVRGACGRARAMACLCRLMDESGCGFTRPRASVGSPPSSLSPPGPGIPRYAASAHPGGTGVSGSGASLSVVAAGGGAAVSGVGASLPVLAAGGGTAASVVGASLSALAVAGGVGRDRDPRPARVVEPRGARFAFAVPAAFRVPAAEDLVLRRVLASARDVVALFPPLASDAGVAAGSRRSISSASARSSATAARATRWAFLPALSLTPLSALAACLRRPTCRSRSNRSASFLAIMYLLALHEIAPSQPYRRLHRSPNVADGARQHRAHAGCPYATRRALQVSRRRCALTAGRRWTRPRGGLVANPRRSCFRPGWRRWVVRKV